MDIDPQIEEIAEEVLEKHGQSDDFKERFLGFYENTIQNNLGKDLERLIENVELPEEEEVDGS